MSRLEEMLTLHQPSDSHILRRLQSQLLQNATSCSIQESILGMTFIETAGGVLSPGPSGTPQADIFRPMRLPVVLVGDHRLGGIGSTISAAESLLVRGYDIDAVVLFDDHSKYENAQYLKGYFAKQGISSFALPWIPDLEGLTETEEGEKMEMYYEQESRQGHTYKLATRLVDQHHKRLRDINSMAERSKDVIWYPFTQHKSIKTADELLVFDSAYNDYFQAKHTPRSISDAEQKPETPLLYPAFDGSASWWTQGLGHGNPQLSLAAAYAAGRYGHVMFAGATHEPALTLAERLIQGLKNPRLSKVFYTDDGSTAVESGIKMGLRASCKRYDWDGSTEDIGILGLKGSYHGDTIGAMDASEPGVYNKKVDWYRGRGYWFDFPTVKMRAGKWVVEPPVGMAEDFGPAEQFEDLDAVFDTVGRAHSPRYAKYITSVLDRLVQAEGRKFGALVMEPIILGAGGMLFVDPLFQRTLVNVVRSYKFSSYAVDMPDRLDTTSWTGLPVLFDEVFTGLYRLGRFSAASFLQIDPDISCHAKLLTGGLLPLSATVASQSIFDAFWSDEKADALLHGHSYTAHPIGCHVANTSLEMMDFISQGRTWETYRRSWHTDRTASSAPLSSQTEDPLSMHRKAPNKVGIWSMWTRDTVVQLSHHPCVEGVIALGSVLAISLVDEAGSGYTSNAAVGLRDALLYDQDDKSVVVHSRVLGNVLYLMASMTTRQVDLSAVEEALLLKLNKLHRGDKKVLHLKFGDTT
jgi:dethiobiotin synthetase/adenosylmethionine--8-amino-7-oxononanoate aminotransferase